MNLDRPKFLYGPAQASELILSLPATLSTRSLGPAVGGDIDADSGIRASYVIYQLELLTFALRYYETEWPDIVDLIEAVQDGQEFLFFPISDDDSVFFWVTLESPAVGTTYSGQPDGSYPRILTLLITLATQNSFDTLGQPPAPISLMATDLGDGDVRLDLTMPGDPSGIAAFRLLDGVDIFGDDVPREAGDVIVKLAIASCWQTGTGGDDVMTAIVAENPDLFLHLGDLHYFNIGTADQAAYRKAYDAVLHAPAMQRLYRNVAMDYVWSDHDFGAGNSDGTSASRPVSEAAYRENFPFYPLAEAEGGHDPIYHSYVVADRVRVIMSDTRSNKTIRSAADNAAKTMMGAAQKAWVKAECLAAQAAGQLIIWATDVPWIGAAVVNDDSWLGYSTERKEMSDFFVANGITDLIHIAGDMHSSAIDDGTNDVWATGPTHPNHMVCQCGPLSQTNSIKGGPFTGVAPIEERSLFMTLAITVAVDTGITEVIARVHDRFGVVRGTVTKNYVL